MRAATSTTTASAVPLPSPGLASRLFGLGSVFGKSFRDSRRAALVMGVVTALIVVVTAASLAAEFDTIILDSPAGYSLIPRSVPAVADEIIVPIRTQYLALESLAQFLMWYRDLPPARRATARLAGILLTMVDYRRQATREIIDIIRRHNRRGVFTTEIPEDPRVAEAPSHGLPVVDYASSSRGSRAYQSFTTELVTRIARRPR